jgi:hypothetical protein
MLIQVKFLPLRASLGAPFFQGISIFPREISSFSLGKIGIPSENGVSKLTEREMASTFPIIDFGV